jgi:hypothetical protein
MRLDSRSGVRHGRRPIKYLVGTPRKTAAEKLIDILDMKRPAEWISKLAKNEREFKKSRKQSGLISTRPKSKLSRSEQDVK